MSICEEFAMCDVDINNTPDSSSFNTNEQEKFVPRPAVKQIQPISARKMKSHTFIIYTEQARKEDIFSTKKLRQKTIVTTENGEKCCQLKLTS